MIRQIHRYSPVGWEIRQTHRYSQEGWMIRQTHRYSQVGWEIRQTYRYSPVGWEIRQTHRYSQEGWMIRHTYPESSGIYESWHITHILCQLLYKIRHTTPTHYTRWDGRLGTLHPHTIYQMGWQIRHIIPTHYIPGGMQDQAYYTPTPTYYIPGGMEDQAYYTHTTPTYYTRWDGRLGILHPHTIPGGMEDQAHYTHTPTYYIPGGMEDQAYYTHTLYTMYQVGWKIRHTTPTLHPYTIPGEMEDQAGQMVMQTKTMKMGRLCIPTHTQASGMDNQAHSPTHYVRWDGGLRRTICHADRMRKIRHNYQHIMSGRMKIRQDYLSSDRKGYTGSMDQELCLFYFTFSGVGCPYLQLF